jgi:hypothetical protein
MSDSEKRALIMAMLRTQLETLYQSCTGRCLAQFREAGLSNSEQSCLVRCFDRYSEHERKANAFLLTQESGLSRGKDASAGHEASRGYKIKVL